MLFAPHWAPWQWMHGYKTPTSGSSPLSSNAPALLLLNSLLLQGSSSCPNFAAFVGSSLHSSQP